LDSLRNGTGPLVIRKLSSALATFFLHFHRVWRRFTHHLCLCLASSQPLRPDALDDAPESSALIESLDSAQTQAALWVLSNVLEDIAKFDLNSASKFVP
jgi:hypothetical protein